MDDRWQEAEALFHELVDADGPARAARLETVDPGLRAEVEELLDAFAASEGERERSLPVSATAPAGRRLGPYTLLHELGEGGMGSVYLAERTDAQFEKQVAVKLIRAGSGSQVLLRRFHTERQILAGLEHPHIARLLDGGAGEDGQPYLVMEYVDGVRLDHYCDQQQLSAAARVRLMAGVCRAVHYAHQNLVVHRDLKPNNILVTPAGEPKLLDFGVAKVLQAGHRDLDLTSTVGLFFTPLYASPEILRGQHTTVATDVYSLGVILYQLLAGVVPHEEHTQSPGDLMNAVLQNDPQLPSEAAGAARGRALRGDLDAIVMRALGKTPAERYGSAEQLAADLERFLARQPVLARRQTWVYRSQKFARRHWRALSVAAVALVAVGIAGGYALRQQWQASQRFEESRGIAKYLLFDLFDEVSRLPGSTAARARLAERAQAELDRLASLDRGNRDVQLETALGYQRLARILGTPGEPNLGEPAAAARNLEQARAILARLGDAPGALAARAENALLRGTVELWTHHRAETAEKLLSEADWLLARAVPGDAVLRLRAGVRHRQVEVADLRSLPAQEGKIAERGLAELDGWPERLRDDDAYTVVRTALLRAKGNVAFYAKQIAAALPYYEQAVREAEEADRRFPNRPRRLSSLMAARYDLATTYDAAHRQADALRTFEAAVATGRALVALEDHDHALRRMYLSQRQGYAELLGEMGRPADAVREQEPVVAEREREAAAHPEDTSRARDLAFSRLVLAKITWKTDRARACQVARRSLDSFTALHAKGSLTTWDWDHNASVSRKLAEQCPASKTL